MAKKGAIMALKIGDMNTYGNANFIVGVGFRWLLRYQMESLLGLLKVNLLIENCLGVDQRKFNMQIFSKEFVSCIKRTMVCKLKGHLESDWMEEHWAPGHGTGNWVKICRRCGIKLEIR